MSGSFLFRLCDYIMRKSLLFIFLLSFFIPLFCNENQVFFITPSVGYSLYTENEILFETDKSIRSLLEWEHKILLTPGISFGINSEKVLLTLSFEYAIPLQQGKMSDYDWKNNIKYSFTEHPIKKSQIISTYLDISYNYNLNSSFFLFPLFQISYDFLNFEADNGSGIRYERPVTVYGVDYRKHSVISFFGFGIIIPVSSSFCCKTDFQISPFCWQQSLDYHHGEDHPFSSKAIQLGFFSKVKTEISGYINISPKTIIELLFSILFSATDKGDFYTNYYTNKMTLIDEKSGSNIKKLSIKILVHYKL